MEIHISCSVCWWEKVSAERCLYDTNRAYMEDCVNPVLLEECTIGMIGTRTILFYLRYSFWRQKFYLFSVANSDNQNMWWNFFRVMFVQTSKTSIKTKLTGRFLSRWNWNNNMETLVPILLGKSHLSQSSWGRPILTKTEVSARHSGFRLRYITFLDCCSTEVVRTVLFIMNFN
jgi:hypothetical protein